MSEMSGNMVTHFELYNERHNLFEIMYLLGF